MVVPIDIDRVQTIPLLLGCLEITWDQERAM